MTRCLRKQGREHCQLRPRCAHLALRYQDTKTKQSAYRTIGLAPADAVADRAAHDHSAIVGTRDPTLHLSAPPRADGGSRLHCAVGARHVVTREGSPDRPLIAARNALSNTLRRRTELVFVPRGSHWHMFAWVMSTPASNLPSSRQPLSHGGTTEKLFPLTALRYLTGLYDLG